MSVKRRLRNVARVAIVLTLLAATAAAVMQVTPTRAVVQVGALIISSILRNIIAFLIDIPYLTSPNDHPSLFLLSFFFQ